MKNLAEFNGALAHQERLRNFPPPLYNQRRIKELPIPNINVGHGDGDEQDINENVIELAPLAEVFVPCTEIDQFEVDINVANEDTVREIADDANELNPLAEALIPYAEIDPFELKFDPIPLDEQSEAELNSALEDESNITEHELSANNGTVNDDDEIIFMGDVPMPAKWCTTDALTKQEDDVISGNLPFATRVCFIDCDHDYMLYTTLSSKNCNNLYYRKTETAFTESVQD